MTVTTPLQVDVEQIRQFVDALFRYADDGSFVSLRAFYDDETRVFAVEAHQVGNDHAALVPAAARAAARAAVFGRPIVFAPPIATFTNATRATEADLSNGLALSVECDSDALAARIKLEGLLGPATVVVASGGEWQNRTTGELEPKLHLHWRLTEPTRDLAGHSRLKECRALAARWVGGDTTSNPAVHPMRWPGSWHRKSTPRLTRIETLTDNEIELDDVLGLLREAVQATHPATACQSASQPAAADETSAGESRDTADLVTAILRGDDYHAPTTALAMRYLKGGMPDAQVVLTLRGIMEAVSPSQRDMKDGAEESGRWQSRYDDLPRAVSTARAKLGPERPLGPPPTIGVGEYRLDRLAEGEPPVQRFLLRPFMPLGTLGLLFGPGGVGKSLAAMDLCLAVACRTLPNTGLAAHMPVLGAAIPADAAGASVFLTLEDDRAEVHRRAVALDPKGTRRDAPCFVIPAVELTWFDPALVTAEGRAAVLTRFAKEELDDLLTRIAMEAGCPVRLLVLDPAGDFLNVDENDATYVKLLMRHLRGVCIRHGCTILLLGHVAKTVDPDGPSMRGSSAWISNSRFAFALWRPVADEAAKLAARLNEAADSLVWGNLVKANHAKAPIGQKRLYVRDRDTGRLIDVTARLSAKEAPQDDMLRQLADFCAECAAAGLPYSHTGVGGLWNGSADLPEPLRSLSRHKLEDLGRLALERTLLVKVRTSHSQGSTKYLDKPDGVLATGEEMEMFHGSREEALGRYRSKIGPA